MRAFEIPGMRYALPAEVAIPRYRFVSVNANGNAIVANATSPVVGVSQNETAAGETQEIITGIVMVEASAAIVAGTKVGPDADGLAGAGTVGVAITGASAAGELVSVLL